MKKHVVLKKRFPSGQTGDIEDDHMVKFYPIVCSLHLKKAPKLKRWFSLHIPVSKKASEDNAKCVQELECIAISTMAAAFIDKFHPNSNFCVT